MLEASDFSGLCENTEERRGGGGVDQRGETQRAAVSERIKGQTAALLIVYHIISIREVEITLLRRKNKGTGVVVVVGGW